MTYLYETYQLKLWLLVLDIVIVCAPGCSPDWSKTNGFSLPVAEIKLRPVCTVSLTMIACVLTLWPPICNTALSPLCKWLASVVMVRMAVLPAMRVPSGGV